MYKLIIFLLFSFQASAQGYFGLNVTPAATYTYDSIQVNIWDSIGGWGKVRTSAWNEWAMPINAFRGNFSQAWKYAGGGQSTIQSAWRYSDGTTGALTGYNDNTNTYYIGQTTGFPDSCFRTSAYCNTSANQLLMFTGLSDSKVYTLRFLASRNTTQARSQTLTFGASSDNVDAWNNKTKIVVINNIVSTSGVANVAISYANAFSFANAYILTERTTN